LETRLGLQFLASWLPFLVLIACWVAFMIYFRRSPVMIARRAWFDQTLHHLEQIEALLQDIARKFDGRK
jgi:hypothetical protein